MKTYQISLSSIKKYEQENKALKPKSLREWIEVFGDDCKPILLTKLKRLRNQKERLEIAIRNKNTWREKHYGDTFWKWLSQKWQDINAGEALEAVNQEITSITRELRPKDDKLDLDIERARKFDTRILAEGLIKAKRNGSRLMACCPSHSENNPSFVVYRDGSFHCFGCGLHGYNAIDYLIKVENYKFKEAVKKLC